MPHTSTNRTAFDAKDVVSPHWVKFNTADGKICYVLTGVIITNLKGNSQSWLREKIGVNIPIPDLPADMAFHIEHWAPLFTLNSAFNKNASVNSGHAIDSFKLTDRVVNPIYGQSWMNFSIDTAISDCDAYLYRIGYSITLTGTLKPFEPIVID